LNQERILLWTMRFQFPTLISRERLIKWIFSSGQGRGERRKVINMLYIKYFLEFASDADMAEIDLNQTFPREVLSKSEFSVDKIQQNRGA